MATAYSSEPINFKNIISNRSPEEIRENITLLITLFIDQSIDITFIYLSHSEVEVSVDTFLDGMIILLQSFFLDENIETLQNYIQKYRQSKIEPDKKKSIESVNKINVNISDQENFPKGLCECDFCKNFRNAKELYINFEPKTMVEKIIYDIIDSDTSREYINNIILNEEFYNFITE
jgi:hypothetical protein